MPHYISHGMPRPCQQEMAKEDSYSFRAHVVYRAFRRVAKQFIPQGIFNIFMHTNSNHSLLFRIFCRKSSKHLDGIQNVIPNIPLNM
jgi:hypothetical protein